MKYLKLYENFTLFKKVSIRDAKTLFNDRGGYEEFSDIEIERIKEVMKDIGKIMPIFADFTGSVGFDKGKVRYEINSHKQRNKNCRIQINKGKDEYFYILVESMFTKSLGDWYECDTIDGLIECLKTLI